MDNKLKFKVSHSMKNYRDETNDKDIILAYELLEAEVSKSLIAKHSVYLGERSFAGHSQ